MKTLYNKLMNLTTSTEVFYLKDHFDGNDKYRVFAYRLSSYTEYCLPGGLECRGIMFLVDGDEMIRVVSRTPHKFFNLNENPLSDFGRYSITEIETIMNKCDGSLISTWTDTTNRLRLKSKTSITSDVCLAATNYLRKHQDLYDELLKYDLNGWTVNLEFTSPNYRIVLPYEEEKLTVLSIRNRESGKYMPLTNYSNDFRNYLVEHFPERCMTHFTHSESVNQYFEKMKDDTGYEGDVIKTKDGDYFKLKTDWYCALHYRKENINSPRRLFECVINEASDDLRQMFASDKMSLKKIDEFECKYKPLYNSMIRDCEQFTDTFKHLGTLDFVNKAKVDLNQEFGYFGIVMSLYRNKSVDYKAHFLKLWKIFRHEYKEVENEN
jgi:T4 RnlA family RNA ligase